MDLNTFINGASTAAKATAKALRTETVLGVPKCSPMYKKSVELRELYQLRDIKETPLVASKIKKIHGSFSESQLKIMHQIIEAEKRQL